MKKVKMILTNPFRPDLRVFKEAQYLVENGFDVEILCWDRKGVFKNSEYEKIDGIKVKRFYPFSTPGSGLKQIGPYMKFLNECRKYLKNKEYDYIHCHDLDGVIIGAIIKKSKTSLIFDMHEFYEVKVKRKKFKLFVKFTVDILQNISNHIIYVNKAQIERISNRNKNKLIYLPNYPEFNHYLNSEKVLSNKLRISYIGTVRQYEQLKNLMEACKEMEDVIISIHGEGVHKEKLKSIEKNYANTKVYGSYHFKDSPKLYSECDILYAVYPMNNYQNQIAEPIKFFEAIVTKTPIITNEGKDIGEFIIKNNIGFTVNANDVESVRNLIKKILSSRKVLVEQQENLKKIQFDYSWEEVVSNLNGIYKVGK